MSIFDPHKVFSKKTKQTRTGQVIQQKPIPPNRPYSREDLEEAKRILTAYKIPYGNPVVPLPAADVYNELMVIDTGLISVTSTNTYFNLNVSELWDLFKTTRSWTTFLVNTNYRQKNKSVLIFDISYPQITLYSGQYSARYSGYFTYDIPIHEIENASIYYDYSTGAAPESIEYIITFSPVIMPSNSNDYSLFLSYGRQETTYDTDHSTYIVQVPANKDILGIYHEAAPVDTEDIIAPDFTPDRIAFRHMFTDGTVDNLKYRLICQASVTLVSYMAEDD